MIEQYRDNIIAIDKEIIEELNVLFMRFILIKLILERRFFMSNLNEIKTLRPFTRFCCTIGNLPSSYLESLTYEEQLLWFCDYIKNTVIPTVNNNAEAVKELQDLYLQLKSYVDNYFENLDVQNEINNKLDEMASSGELTSIMQPYFNILSNKIDSLETEVNSFDGDLSTFKNTTSNNINDLQNQLNNVVARCRNRRVFFSRNFTI